MMKCLSKALVVVIGLLAVTNSPTYGQEVNSPNATGYGQAAVLVTEPVTINNQASNTPDRSNELQEIANSIQTVRENKCKKLNPVDFIKDPGAIFEECSKQTNHHTVNPTEQIGYFKVPRLDSGTINVTVTKF